MSNGIELGMGDWGDIEWIQYLENSNNRAEMIKKDPERLQIYNLAPCYSSIINLLLIESPSFAIN